jgi:hypothetical protein
MTSKTDLIIVDMLNDSTTTTSARAVFVIQIRITLLLTVLGRTLTI